MHNLLSYWNNAWAGAMTRGEESEEEDGTPFEEFGALRLPLKPGTLSGYVGVQRTTSKKRPWQATVKLPGRKRLNVGSFKEPHYAAVARAQALAAAPETLPSPRKQAPRNSGAWDCAALWSLSLSSTQSLTYSARLAVVSQAVDSRGPHAPHASRGQREPLAKVVGGRRDARRRSRARSERSLLSAVRSELLWRAERPAAAVGPAPTPGCGSFCTSHSDAAAALILTRSGARPRLRRARTRSSERLLCDSTCA